MAVLTFLANPARFMVVSRWLAPLLGASAAGLLVVGVWLGLSVPVDYQQGATVEIMFVHVPAAWMGMFIYACVGGASFFGLVFRHPLADAAAKAAAPLGAAFTALALVTGSLWGRPMWGTWWVWDARLTSVLVLFFLYLGHIALVRAFDSPERGARAGAILALVGAVDLPVIKFSVEWWNTLHQPATITLTGSPTMYVGMLWPLLFSALGMTVGFVAIVLARTRAAVMERRIRGLLLARAQQEAGARQETGARLDVVA